MNISRYGKTPQANPSNRIQRDRTLVYPFSLAGIAVILIAAYILVLQIKAQSTAVAGVTSTELPAVWELPVDNITQITVEPYAHESNGARLVFESTQTHGWILSSPAGLRYDASIAEGIAPNVARLVPEKEIGSHSDGLEQYGLDSPTTIRVFTYNEADASDSGEYDILLGGATTTGDAYYFAVSDSDAIYTMSSEKARSLLLDSTNVLDKNVLGFNRSLRPSAIAQSIKNITVNGAVPADGQMLALTLARINALEFIDSIDLQQFGLDAPSLTIDFENEYGMHTLYIGNVAGDGEVYASVEGLEAVFTVPSRGL